MMNFVTRAALLAASTALIPSAAGATVMVDISEVGPNVQATASGSLNLTGLTNYETSSAIIEAIYPSPGFAEVGNGSQAVNGFVGFTSYPASLGPGGLSTYSSSVSGDPFAVYGAFGMVWLPDGYASGSAISSGATWLGQSLASLGLTPGSYVFTAPADKVVVNIEPLTGAVPEASTWAMMLLGFLAIGSGLRRRRGRLAHASTRMVLTSPGAVPR